MTAALPNGLHPVRAGKLAAVVTMLEMHEPPASLATEAFEGRMLGLVPYPRSRLR